MNYIFPLVHKENYNFKVEEEVSLLKLKKGAPLKQFFNIILGIGIIKKNNFLFVF